MRRRLSWQLLGRSIENGPWRMDLSVGSEEAGLVTRAITARHSTFALRAPETVYFATGRDSSGKPLDAASTYSIEGTDLDARWWSLTAYKQRHLIANEQNRYSYSKTTVARRADGSWTILLSPRQQSENWLPTGEPEGPVGLILRFYEPGPELLSKPATVRLPRIEKVATSP